MKMKRILLISLCAISMVAISSCKEETPEEPGTSFTIVASTDNFTDPAAKTTLDGREVKWVNGDKISVAVNDTKATVWTTGQVFTFDNGYFKSSSTIPSGSYEFKVIYGPDDQIALNKSIGTTYTVSGTQVQDCSKPTEHLAKYDGLAGKFSVTTPATSAAIVKMSHLFTLMEVDLQNTLGKDLTITSFTITAISNIAGVYSVDFSDTPVASYKESGSKSITVNLSNGSLSSGGSLPVYFVMAPLTNYSGSITLTATDSNGNKYTTSKTLTSKTFAAGAWNKTNFTLRPAGVSTLAEIAAKATTTESTFSATVQDVIVTAVGGKYAHIEDESGAIMIWMSSHGLSVGQKINGAISGKIVLYDGYSTYKGPGYAEMTKFDKSKATVTTGATIPYRELTVSEINANITDYFNQRILLKGITVTTGISSSSMTGQISQGGETIQIYNKNKAASISSGLIGDLYAFPVIHKGTKQLLIYTSDQFEEKTVPVVEDGFTKITVPGVYDISNIDSPTTIYAIKSDDQSVYSKGSSNTYFRIQNLNDGVLYGAYANVSSLIVGTSFSATILKISGTTSESTSATLSVAKTNTSMVWLKDNTANKGYIFNIL